MNARLLASCAVLLTACYDFEAGYRTCFDSGKCIEPDAGSGGGTAAAGGGSTAGGSGGGAAGGDGGGSATGGGTAGCVDGGTGCPNGFACEASSCKTTCTSTSDCQTHFECTAPDCTRIAESDCLDGLDNNGDGLPDCMDPSCTAQVMCAPAVSAGNEIGVFGDAGCSGTYGVATPEHQSLSVPSCADCGCIATGTCRNTLDFFSNASCTGSPSSTTAFDGACAAAAAPGQPAAVRFNNQTLVNPVCVPDGGPARPDPTWGTTLTFCATNRQSTTCAANQVCIAKPPAPLCVRVPQAGAACPAGYTGNPFGTWHGVFTDDRVCGCGTCTATSGGSCPGFPAIYLFYPDQPTCLASGGGGANVGNANASNASGNGCLANMSPGCAGASFDCWGTIGALFVTTNLPAGGTCSRPGQVTSGSAAPSQPSTICCQ